MVSLAAPAAAQAGTLSLDGTTVVFRDTAADTVNDVHVLSSSGEHIIGDDGTDPTDDGSGCEDVGAGYWSCPNATAFRIETGGGNDGVSGQAGPDSATLPLIVDLGDGDDGFIGGLADDIVQGGPGNESCLCGFEGNDFLDGGPGSDWFEGGSGSDVVSYATRTEAVIVDLGAAGLTPHGSANDGSPGARDHIRDDVEVIVGGSGDDVLKGAGYPVTLRGAGGGDTITGSTTADTLDGGDGADSLNGLGGPDTVLGGSGVDTVEARDGAVDSIDCGPDDDNASVDAIDAVAGCAPDPPPVTPAPTIITNTVTLPSRLLFDLGYTYVSTRRGTTLRNFAVQAESGAQVTASCRAKRKRCKGTRDFARAAAAREVRLRSFEGKRLPVGAKLTIQVTKPGTIGAVKTLTIRRRRAPSVRTLCLPPGATRPSAC